MKKTIIVLALLILIVLGGYWIWQISQSNQNQDQNTQQDVEQNTSQDQEPEIINSDIDTSDWLAYRNEEYGFSFEYPQDWVVNFNVNEDNFLPRIIVSPKNIIEYNDSTPLQIILVSTYSEDDFNILAQEGKKVKNIDIAGISALEYSFEIEFNIHYRIIRLIDLPNNKWGDMNQIVYRVNRENADLIVIYDKILSSIKFFK